MENVRQHTFLLFHLLEYLLAILYTFMTNTVLDIYKSMIFIAAAISERESPGRIYDNSAVTPSHHLMMKTNDFN